MASSFTLVAGDTLHLTSVQTGHATSLIVEPIEKGVMLARPEQPYHRLHAAAQKQGKIFFAQTRGNSAAIWLIEKDDELISIRARACGSWLTLDKDGKWTLQASAAYWRLHSEDERPLANTQTAACDFDVDGYVMMPQLVAPHKIARALRFLNHHLGAADLAADLEPDGLGAQYVRAAAAHDSGGLDDSALDDGVVTGGVVKLGGGHVCTCCLAQSAVLLELLGATERQALVTALKRTYLGRGDRGEAGDAGDGGDAGDAGDGGSAAPIRLCPMFGCQVALRFPLSPFSAGVTDGEAALPGLLRLSDGLDWHTDAAKYNDKKSFHFVVGVFLSAVGCASEGALMVQPGSQHDERRAREQGELPKGALHSSTAATGAGSEARAVPILAEPGTAIVFDKDLLHAGAPNLSSNIRYALYFRMRLLK